MKSKILFTAALAGLAVLMPACSDDDPEPEPTVCPEPTPDPDPDPEPDPDPVQEAPSIGDFYYSDGTWSTDADKTKTIIGVVFWTGDPTADDATLRADHPDCTHGLVVSLEQDPSAWQSKYEAYGTGKTVNQWVMANAPQLAPIESATGINDPIQKITGYNNTKAIEAFNADPANSQWPVDAVANAVAYRTAVPAPASSSDWYLPSPKELSLLCAGEIEGSIYIVDPISTNVKAINPRIELAGGSPIGNLALWASMEAVDPEQSMVTETAWNYYVDERRPLSYSFKSWEEFARTRYVIAF